MELLSTLRRRALLLKQIQTYFATRHQHIRFVNGAALCSTTAHRISCKTVKTCYLVSISISITILLRCAICQVRQRLRRAFRRARLICAIFLRMRQQSQQATTVSAMTQMYMYGANGTAPDERQQSSEIIFNKLAYSRQKTVGDYSFVLHALVVC